MTINKKSLLGLLALMLLSAFAMAGSVSAAPYNTSAYGAPTHQNQGITNWHHRHHHHHHGGGGISIHL
jgi:hypothetical protein